MKKFISKPSQLRGFSHGHHFGWFYCDLYGENIHVLWNVTTAQLAAYMKREFGVTYAKELLGGRCIEVVKESDGASKAQVIALRKWNGSPVAIGTLAHEAFHCADHILSSRGFKLDDEHSEAHAYLVGWVVDQCLQVITNKPR